MSSIPNFEAASEHGVQPSIQSANRDESAPCAGSPELGRKPVYVLAINSGSSSLRFALFISGEALTPILVGKFERIGLPDSALSFTDYRTKQTDKCRIAVANHAACVAKLGGLLANIVDDRDIAAIGHRVVHGGLNYHDASRVDETMLEELRRLILFAPNHLPAAIELIEIFAAKFPRVPQIACFDTAFHHTMPRVAKLLPIPRRYEAQGLRRYGFHGLSYAYLLEELIRLGDPAATSGRVILAHLGNGASMAAVLDGKSIDTTMGFTPAAGMMMSTRSGDLDPGVFAYLMRSEQMTGTSFDQMIHHESGLLGVSETSSDMRDLLEQEASDGRAADAVSMFCYQAKKWIGSYAAAMGGLDTLVFAGGIGENAPVVRQRICNGLGFLGLELDESHNVEDAAVISTPESRVSVRVMRTDEELMIARSVCRVLGLNAAP